MILLPLVVDLNGSNFVLSFGFPKHTLRAAVVLAELFVIHWTQSNESNYDFLFRGSIHKISTYRSLPFLFLAIHEGFSMLSRGVGFLLFVDHDLLASSCVKSHTESFCWSSHKNCIESNHRISCHCPIPIEFERLTMTKYDRSTRKPSAKRRLDFGDDSHETSEEDPVVIVESEEPTQKKLKTSTAAIPSTPEQKRRWHDKHETQGISTYFSPKPAKKAAVITPEKKEEEKVETEKPKEQAFVPIYIHKNLNYQRKGQASLNPKRQRVFDLVKDHCVIPDDFETNRRYGPLSGTCFEERAIDAYEKRLLKTTSIVEICTYCAKVGHEQDECPDLV